MKAKHWYDYLWVYAIIYFALGFFNILFAWLGMIDFLLPLFLAIFGGNNTLQPPLRTGSTVQQAGDRP